MASKKDYDDTYDVFLSYRRDGGETMAILLRDRLVAKGYRVFLDVEGLRSGSFNKKLLLVIEGCTDFVSVLSKDSLDRCVNESDWVRQEIAHALRHDKNVVPVMLRGFDWPKNLPDDIAELPNRNGVNATNNEFFDAAVDRLATHFLMSEPQKKAPKINWRVPAIAVGVLAVAAIIFAAVLNWPKTPESDGVASVTDTPTATAPTSQNDPSGLPIVSTPPTDSGGASSVPAGVKIGDVIPFGKYEWVVLERQGDYALLLSSDNLFSLPYDSSEFSYSLWEKCSLRKYLNEDFYNSFSDADKARIVDSTDESVVAEVQSHDWGEKGLGRIFCLTYTDYMTRFVQTSDLYELFYNHVGNDWWIRNGSYSLAFAWTDYEGVLSGTDGDISKEIHGVRPAMWIKLDSGAAERTVGQEAVGSSTEGNSKSTFNFVSDGLNLYGRADCIVCVKDTSLHEGVINMPTYSWCFFFPAGSIVTTVGTGQTTLTSENIKQMAESAYKESLRYTDGIPELKETGGHPTGTYVIDDFDVLNINLQYNIGIDSGILEKYSLTEDGVFEYVDPNTAPTERDKAPFYYCGAIVDGVFQSNGNWENR